MNDNVFEKFKLLKSDMEENNWTIDAFNFNYKNNDFVVLIKLYTKNEKKPTYALLKTEFIKLKDSSCLELIANVNGFLLDKNEEKKEFRTFFNIGYRENVGDIFRQFNQYFSKFIPTKVLLNKSQLLKKSMISSLDKSDSQSPDKIYCIYVGRNKKNGKRSVFNENKTMLLRPELYLKFKDDPFISFFYSREAEKEKTDNEILLNFSKKKYYL